MKQHPPIAAALKSVAPAASLSDQVADALSAQIRSGRLTSGSKLPTEAA
ncbi:MAG: GntR family transcriptional regulator, partial [Rhodoferax sp.]|nr:GntR family transcriptional regulator [Rhodoferax sp.]